jgi:hypothetical protein
MKIRNGFVSNSSSSSFVISDDKFPTVRSLANYMIKQKIKENYEEEDDYENHIKYNDYNKLLMKRLQNVDVNQAVSFPSCNYDTYIRKVGDCYLVATCNNTDWNLDEYHTYLTDKAKNALKELMKFFEGTKEYEYIKDILEDQRSEFSHIGKDYYALNVEIIGVETYDSCPKCSVGKTYTGEYMWNTPQYGKICLKCNPIFKRKDKLYAISKLAENDEKT